MEERETLINGETEFQNKKLRSNEKRMGENAYNARKVSQLNNEGKVINTFPSMADASRAVGVRTQDIYSCCTGRQKTAHGYGWKYDG